MRLQHKSLTPHTTAPCTHMHGAVFSFLKGGFMWDTLSASEKLEFLQHQSGLDHATYTHEMISPIEFELNEKQRDIYVDYCSAYAADVAYRRVDPEHERAASVYYFTLMRIPLEIRAKMLWHVLTGNQP